MPSAITDRRRGLVGDKGMKAPVDCATTVNITLSGEQTIDGVTTDESRVLVKNQNTASENGIYVSSTGSWTRDIDANKSYDLVDGTLVPIAGGNQSYSIYQVTTANPITIDTTSITFSVAFTAQSVSAYVQTLLAAANAAAARTLLEVAPRATRIDVASVAGTVNLTTAAPDTDDIRITGTNAITGFTVAVGRVFRVTAGGAFTLTNNSNIVTQEGANIVCTAGDTFMLRATAANTVEVMNYRYVSLTPTALQTIQRGYLDGLTLSTAGSSATMSIAAGQAADTANAVLISLSAAINKTTSAWAVGSATGGLDTGAIANSTWYYFYLIRRTDTGVVDVVFSTNSTTPTLPTNYTQYRYIGAGLTNGSAQWTLFSQDGDRFQWSAPVQDVNATTSGTSAVLRTLSVPRKSVIALMNVNVICTDAGGELTYISDPAVSDQAPSTSASPGVTIQNAGALNGAGYVECRTNTSAQIRTRQATGNGNTTLRINTRGWIDLRGKET